MPRAISAVERSADALVSRFADPVRAIGARTLGMVDRLLRMRLAPFSEAGPQHGAPTQGMPLPVPWYERPERAAAGMRRLGPSAVDHRASPVAAHAPAPAALTAPSIALPPQTPIATALPFTERGFDPVLLARDDAAAAARAESMPALERSDAPFTNSAPTWASTSVVDPGVAASGSEPSHESLPPTAARSEQSSPVAARPSGEAPGPRAAAPLVDTPRPTSATPPQTVSPGLAIATSRPVASAAFVDAEAFAPSTTASGHAAQSVSAAASPITEQRAGAAVAAIGQGAAQLRTAALPQALHAHAVAPDDRSDVAAVAAVAIGALGRVFAHVGWADGVLERAVARAVEPRRSDGGPGLTYLAAPEAVAFAPRQLIGESASLAAASTTGIDAGSSREWARPETPFVTVAPSSIDSRSAELRRVPAVDRSGASPAAPVAAAASSPSSIPSRSSLELGATATEALRAVEDRVATAPASSGPGTSVSPFATGPTQPASATNAPESALSSPQSAASRPTATTTSPELRTEPSRQPAAPRDGRRTAAIAEGISTAWSPALALSAAPSDLPAGSAAVVSFPSGASHTSAMREARVDVAGLPGMGFVSTLGSAAGSFGASLSRFVAELTGTRAAWDARILPVVTPYFDDAPSGAQRSGPGGAGAVAASGQRNVVGEHLETARRAPLGGYVATFPSSDPRARATAGRDAAPIEPPPVGASTRQIVTPTATTLVSSGGVPSSASQISLGASSAAPRFVESERQSSPSAAAVTGPATPSWRPGSLATHVEQAAGHIGIRAAGMSTDFVDPARMPLLEAFRLSLQRNLATPNIDARAWAPPTAQLAPPSSDEASLAGQVPVMELAAWSTDGNARGVDQRGGRLRSPLARAAADTLPSTLDAPREAAHAAPSAAAVTSAPNLTALGSASGAEGVSSEHFAPSRFVDTPFVEGVARSRAASQVVPEREVARQLRDVWSLLSVFPATAVSSIEALAGSAAGALFQAGNYLAGLPGSRATASAASANRRVEGLASHAAPESTVSAAAARGADAPRLFVAPTVAAPDRPALPDGRLPRGSFTWSRAVDFAAQFSAWEPPSHVAAALVSANAPADAPADGVPVWRSLPSISPMGPGAAGGEAGEFQGAFVGASEQIVSSTGAPISGGGASRTAPGPSRRSELNRAAPALALLRGAASGSVSSVASRSAAGESPRSSQIAPLLDHLVTAAGGVAQASSSGGSSASSRSWTPSVLQSGEPATIGATPSGEASTRIVEAMRASQSGTSDDRVSLADLTLVAVASATQQLAASSTASHGPSHHDEGHSHGAPSHGGHGSKKSAEAEQREIDEIAHQVLDEVHRMLEIAGERSGSPWQS